MTVLVHCSCGRSMSVPDSYVGRRVNCTHCGNALDVTPPEPEPATTADSVPGEGMPGEADPTPAVLPRIRPKSTNQADAKASPGPPRPDRTETTSTPEQE